MNGDGWDGEFIGKTVGRGLAVAGGLSAKAGWGGDVWRVPVKMTLRNNYGREKFTNGNNYGRGPLGIHNCCHCTNCSPLLGFLSSSNQISKVAPPCLSLPFAGPILGLPSVSLCFLFFLFFLFRSSWVMLGHTSVCFLFVR